MQRLTESELRSEMARLLQDVSPTKLAKKLGLKSRQPIYDWQAGRSVSIQRLLQVSEATNRPIRWPDEIDPPWPQMLSLLVEIRDGIQDLRGGAGKGPSAKASG